MPDTKTSDETAAGALDGSELVRIVQGAANRRTTTQAIADLGGGGGSGDDAVTTLAFVNSSLGTIDGSNIYGLSGGISITAGDAYELRGVFTGYTAAKGVGLMILDGATFAAKGYLWAVQADGNITLNEINNAVVSNLRTSGGSFISARPDTIIVRAEIGFGSTNNYVVMPDLSRIGGTPTTGPAGSGIATFAGANAFIMAYAATFADLKRIQLTKINP